MRHLTNLSPKNTTTANTLRRSDMHGTPKLNESLAAMSPPKSKRHDGQQPHSRPKSQQQQGTHVRTLKVTLQGNFSNEPQFCQAKPRKSHTGALTLKMQLHRYVCYGVYYGLAIS